MSVLTRLANFLHPDLSQPPIVQSRIEATPVTSPAEEQIAQMINGRTLAKDEATLIIIKTTTDTLSYHIDSSVEVVKASDLIDLRQAGLVTRVVAPNDLNLSPEFLSKWKIWITTPAHIKPEVQIELNKLIKQNEAERNETKFLTERLWTKAELLKKLQTKSAQ